MLGLADDIVDLGLEGPHDHLVSLFNLFILLLYVPAEEALAHRIVKTLTQWMWLLLQLWLDSLFHVLLETVPRDCLEHSLVHV